MTMMLTGMAICAQQQIGTPFFKNYTSMEYGAHNRNFDILCDDEGHTFVANFEGLLVYDNASWRIIHTPGISRVTDLYWKGKKLCFQSVAVEGTVESVDGDSIKVSYSESVAKQTAISDALGGQVERWNGVVVNQKISTNDGMTYLATATEGVIALNAQGQVVWSLKTSNGLCSNSINAIATDNKGTLWGATDNGLFSANIDNLYTYFGEEEGLMGQVTSIKQTHNNLYVGTMLGLFRQETDHFERVEEIELACWGIDVTPDGQVLAATATGLFLCTDSPRKLSEEMTLSVLTLDDTYAYVGTLDGIYRMNYRNGLEMELVDEISQVVKMSPDGKNGYYAIDLNGNQYHQRKGSSHFEKLNNGPMSLLLSYTDDRHFKWHPQDNGLGLVCEGMPDDKKLWLIPFASHNVQAMLLHDGIGWVGGNFGLIRMHLSKAIETKPSKPQVYIRTIQQDGRTMFVTVSNDKLDHFGTVRYSYKLHERDQWSGWDDGKELKFLNLSYGNYELKVRSVDALGQISESAAYAFTIPFPFFLRWYALIVYLLLIALFVQQMVKLRIRRMRKEQERLERIVDERTMEVVKQKDEIETQKNEIEEKSAVLEHTLTELKNAQSELVRKEREATVGKLTKGLIDRILNPMNYINNFSHLTLGLTKDMKDNIEDINEGVTGEDGLDKDEFQDTYEDCLDVLDMMKQNLEKIEQHGLSTTRILKAMEELLKDRSGNRAETDMSALCQQNYEMVNNYFAEDIRTCGISIEWQKPSEPVMATIIAEQMSKTIMSMLANSIYALKKKSAKGDSGFKPLLRLRLEQKNGAVGISVYDNGIGIEESILGKVFDPFFTTKPTAEAPGVGLYLSQQVVMDLGGTISVESRKDEYTEFKINIPTISQDSIG